MRANGNGTVPVAVKRQFVAQIANQRLSLSQKSMSFYTKTQKNTALCIGFCIDFPCLGGGREQPKSNRSF